MKASELRGQDANALQDKLEKLCKEYFDLLMQKSSGHLKDTSKLKKTKRNIARVKTIILETND